ncbi:MAG: metal ABC transporter substrate-binding protein [Armatimonadota bacterium]|nr:metal ABC transporter substrate-binding protein [bacterium]
MRKLGLALVAIFAAMSLLGGCTSKPQKSSGKMLVAASIGPLGNFANEVGGNLVDVQVLVQPGASPHTYQLSADQMEMLSQASVLVLNGLHLEFWADKAINAADNPKLIVVHTADGLPVIEGKDEEHGDVHPGGNPHVWLNPMYAIHQVETIRDAFIKADPSHKSQYTKNAADYVAKLRKLDKDIRAEVATFKSRDFITFHPTWVYFAREYGLVEAAAIEKSPGREPSPSEIGDIVDLCKREHIRAIFAEPQFSPKAAEVVADECGARVLMLNTIGQPPDFDYIKMMRDNVNEMAKALK